MYVTYIKILSKIIQIFKQNHRHFDFEDVLRVFDAENWTFQNVILYTCFYCIYLFLMKNVIIIIRDKHVQSIYSEKQSVRRSN